MSHPHQLPADTGPRPAPPPTPGPSTAPGHPVPMSKVTARTTTAIGHPVTLDAGYDPGTGVYFLDIYRDDQDRDTPAYESMFHHAAGLTTYNELDLATDLERHLGRSLPSVMDAIGRLGRTPNTVRHLGTL